MLADVEVDDRLRGWTSLTRPKSPRKRAVGTAKKSNGDQVADGVGEELPAGLRRRGAGLRDQLGESALGHGDAQLEEFASCLSSPRCPPSSVREILYRPSSLSLGTEPSELGTSHTPGQPIAGRPTAAR